MNNGYIILHRKFLEWEHIKKPNDVALFIHLLLTANWKDSQYKNINVPKGSLITSRKELAKKTGLTEQQIRSTIKRLKSTNTLTIKSTNKFSLITLVNWEKYQVLLGNQPPSQPTLMHDTPKKSTTYEIKNTNNINIYVEEFENLWKIYPKKEGKTKAQEKYLKYRKEGVTYEKILNGLNSYINYLEKNKTERQYIKNGSTWFNQKCWEDDYGDTKKEEPSIKQVGEGVFQF